MKIIKTSSYSRQRDSYKKDLALKVLDWHGGQSSALYSVGSSWLASHDVPIEVVDEAIYEIDREISDIKRSAANIRSQEQWTEYEENLDELEWIKKSLREEMMKEDLFDNQEDIDLNLMGGYDK